MLHNDKQSSICDVPVGKLLYLLITCLHISYHMSHNRSRNKLSIKVKYVVIACWNNAF